MVKAIAPIIIFAVGMVVVLIIWLINEYITWKRMTINQKEWDEYSKGMTRDEKEEVFLEFLAENQLKHGWDCCYPPRM